MSNMALTVIPAFFLDLLIGDPRGYPHPVKIMGWTIHRLELWTRKHFTALLLAGTATTLIVVAGTYIISRAILGWLAWIHPLAGTAGSILLIYTTISIRDLYQQSRPVLDHLQRGEKEMAKKSLSMIVGRDTQDLDRSGIVRATVETIAESMVDGIISPLFYACIGGAPLALAYKAINTLDSMIGHNDETYHRFGKFAARLDDIANWVPARLGGLIIALASSICGFSGKESLRTVWRDGQKHLSPNAGIPEAAVAGALGIQLGGPSFYEGVRIDKPLIGESKRNIELSDIAGSHKIMFASSMISLIVFVIIGKTFGF